MAPFSWSFALAAAAGAGVSALEAAGGGVMVVAAAGEAVPLARGPAQAAAKANPTASASLQKDGATRHDPRRISDCILSDAPSAAVRAAPLFLNPDVLHRFQLA
jgi:hypothetical protein